MKKVKVKINKENFNEARNSNALKLIGILILVFITIFIIINVKKLGIIKFKNKEINYYNYIDLTYDRNTKTIPYKNEILVFTENKITTVKSNGKITWEKELTNILNPLIAVEGDYIVLAEKNSNSYIIFKNKKEIVKNEINGEIKQIDINKYGKVALIYSGEGYKSILDVFNNNSKVIFKKPLKSDVVNNLIFSNDNKNIYYTNIEISGVISNSYLNKINIKDKNKNLENIHTEKENIIHNLKLEKNILFLQLTDNIKTIYTKRNKSTSMFGLENKQVMFVDNDNFYYSYVYKNNTNLYKDNMEVYTINNKKIAKINLEISPKIFVMDDGIIAVASDKKIIVYNYLGKIVKEYDSKANITDIKLFNNGKSLLIKIANKIYIETL